MVLDAKAKTDRGSIPPPADQQANPFRINTSSWQLMGRLVCLVLAVSPGVVASPLLLWAALPVWALIFITAWGIRIIFRDTIKQYSWPPENISPLPQNAPLPHVTVIMPVRNEEAGIERCVRSLAAIDYPARENIVVDDNSTDSTWNLLTELAEQHPNIRIEKAPPLPPGWIGKSHAAWHTTQLTQGPDEGGEGWLLFTDSRVTYTADSLNRIVAYAEGRNLDLLSCLPFFANRGLLEALLAPLKLRPFLTLMYRNGIERTHGAAGGIGAFILTRRKVYQSFGGHSAFPDHVIEDAMLGATSYRYGYRVGVLFTPKELNMQRYQSYADIRDRSIRSLRSATCDQVTTLVSDLALDLLVFTIPLPFALVCLASQIVGGQFNVLLTVTGLFALSTYLTAAFLVRDARSLSYFPPVAPWLHPVGAIIKIWLRILSLAEIIAGSPINWRGRTVATPKNVPS